MSLRCRPISELTARVLQGMGLDRKRSEAEIVRVWNQLLDPTVTAHAQPTGIRKGTLFVTVDSSVWLDEIVRYRYREILEQLQTSFGKDFVTRGFRFGRASLTSWESPRGRWAMENLGVMECGGKPPRFGGPSYTRPPSNSTWKRGLAVARPSRELELYGRE